MGISASSLQLFAITDHCSLRVRPSIGLFAWCKVDHVQNDAIRTSQSSPLRFASGGGKETCITLTNQYRRRTRIPECVFLFSSHRRRLRTPR
jgi:hypothetical protein